MSDRRDLRNMVAILLRHSPTGTLEDRRGAAQAILDALDEVGALKPDDGEDCR